MVYFLFCSLKFHLINFPFSTTIPHPLLLYQIIHSTPAIFSSLLLIFFAFTPINHAYLAAASSLIFHHDHCLNHQKQSFTQIFLFHIFHQKCLFFVVVSLSHHLCPLFIIIYLERSYIASIFAAILFFCLTSRLFLCLSLIFLNFRSCH